MAINMITGVWLDLGLSLVLADPWLVSLPSQVDGVWLDLGLSLVLADPWLVSLPSQVDSVLSTCPELVK